MTAHAKLAGLIAGTALCLALAPPAEATVTLEVAADRLGAADGTPAPPSSLVLLVADLGGAGPGRAVSGPLTTYGYLDGNRATQLVVFRSDLSALAAPGALALSAAGLSLADDPSGRWIEGTPLFLVWFPTLDATATSLPIDAPFGYVPLGATPRDGGFASYAYLTPPPSTGLFGPGPLPAGALSAPASEVVVDGATDPLIQVAPAVLPSPLTTTYGTPSAPLAFAVSGIDLSGPVTVTAPAGFEVGLSSAGPFGPLAVVPVDTGNGGQLPPTAVFARIRATSPVSGAYDGAVFSFAGGGADPTVAASSASGNAVAPKPLSVGGLIARNKIYDGTTTVTVEGTPFFEGLVDGDDFPFTASLTWAFLDKRAGNNRPVSPSESIDPPSPNYTVPTPVLTTLITTRNVTIGGASVVTRPYDGTRVAEVVGAAVVGVLGEDEVEAVGGGTFSSANAGTGIVVTGSFSLAGPDASNYRIFQQPSLVGTILPVAQSIQLIGTLSPNQPTNASVSLAVTGGASGLPARFVVVSGPGRIVNGALSFTAPGEVIVDIFQDGSRNYEAAEPVRLVFEVGGLPAPDLAVGRSLAAVLGYSGAKSGAKTAVIVSRRLRPVNGFVGILNRGDLAESMGVAAGRGNARFRVNHFDPAGNVTAPLAAGRYETPVIGGEGPSVSWIRTQVRPDRRKLTRRLGARKVVVRRTLTVPVRTSSTFDPSLRSSATTLYRTR